MNTFTREYLEKIVPVSFELEMADELVTIGTDRPKFKVKLNQDLRKKDLLLSTSLALGEAYMRKDLEVDQDLYDVINSFLGEIGKFTTNRKGLHALLATSTSKKNQQKEVSSHYDIGNEFYELWLDKSMMYSCAYFEQEDDTLYQAQVNKVDHILEKLQLKPGMTLLDIGCGWGFLLRRAVAKYHVKGVGITLSQEQYKKFNQDIIKYNMQKQLEVQLMDYRELEKSGLTFDRVVSVGMIEHVGRENYELFFQNVKAVLKQQGLFLLHFISARKEFSGDPFIKKYIFPGGVIPSLREVMQIMGEDDFYTLDVESLRRHYTKTLLYWRENYHHHEKEILKMQGEEFYRMWDLYLASCAAAFWNGVVDLHQIVMSNGVNNDLPMHRAV